MTYSYPKQFASTIAPFSPRSASSPSGMTLQKSHVTSLNHRPRVPPPLPFSRVGCLSLANTGFSKPSALGLCVSGSIWRERVVWPESEVFDLNSVFYLSGASLPLVRVNMECYFLCCRVVVFYVHPLVMRCLCENIGISQALIYFFYCFFSIILKSLYIFIRCTCVMYWGM